MLRFFEFEEAEAWWPAASSQPAPSPFCRVTSPRLPARILLDRSTASTQFDRRRSQASDSLQTIPPFIGEGDSAKVMQKRKWLDNVTIGSMKRRKDMEERAVADHKYQNFTEIKKELTKRSLKLRDRITTLQQLVSPFGKTDTASVLQQAAVYIKALHEQIRLLTCSYLGSSSSFFSQDNERRRTRLDDKGLCLVPISPSIICLTNQQPLDRSTRETLSYRSGNCPYLHNCN